MGYCPDLNYDIFISYAHADNGFGWVDKLHDTLMKRLPEDMASQKPNLFFDRNRQALAGKLIDGGILEALQSSAVLLAVGSGAYLASDYCKLERDNFRHPHFPNRLGNYSRIITASYNVPADHLIPQWPEELRAVQVVEFHTPNGPRSWTRRAPGSRYWQAIEQLVGNIVSVIGELRKGRNERASEVATLAVPVERPKTLVTAYNKKWKPSAHVSSPRETRDRANQIVASLLPHCQLVTSLTDDAAEERRLRYLQNADVQLLVFDCAKTDWAESSALEALEVACKHSRPRRIGIVSDCPEDFGVYSDRIFKLNPYNGGLQAFLRGLEGQ